MHETAAWLYGLALRYLQRIADVYRSIRGARCDEWMERRRVQRENASVVEANHMVFSHIVRSERHGPELMVTHVHNPSSIPWRPYSSIPGLTTVCETRCSIRVEYVCHMLGSIPSDRKENLRTRSQIGAARRIEGG